jgi:response regulator RpfG family c-di-GMP phosphodiesterase
MLHFNPSQPVLQVLGTRNPLDDLYRRQAQVPELEQEARWLEHLARALAWTTMNERTFVERTALAARFSQIGKTLTVANNEPQTPRTHSNNYPDIGARILEHAGRHDLAHIVRAQCERFDGRGYPNNLSRSQIPLESRIIAVAKAYQGMRAVRSFRFQPLSQVETINEIKRGAGSEFCPQVVAALSFLIKRNLYSCTTQEENSIHREADKTYFDETIVRKLAYAST